jgi:5-methylcytosine-specific restriction endonuclease McrA
MRIGLDVDGTVYDWEGTFRSMLHRFHGLNIPVSVEWDSIEKSCTAEQWSSVWDAGRAELFTGGLYYPGAQRFVQKLLEYKHEVFFITATPENIRTLRAHALFEDFPGISGVVFVRPGSDNKTFLKCDVYLDDKVETALATLRANHRSILMSRPWNQVNTRPGVIRAEYWEDVTAEIFRNLRAEGAKKGRFSGHCVKCGCWRRSLHRDHIIPKVAGGEDIPDNIQRLCANCHQDKTFEEQRSLPKNHPSNVARLAGLKRGFQKFQDLPYDHPSKVKQREALSSGRVKARAALATMRGKSPWSPWNKGKKRQLDGSYQ